METVAVDAEDAVRISMQVERIVYGSGSSLRR